MTIVTYNHRRKRARTRKQLPAIPMRIVKAGTVRSSGPVRNSQKEKAPQSAWRTSLGCMMPETAGAGTVAQFAGGVTAAPRHRAIVRP